MVLNQSDIKVSVFGCGWLGEPLATFLLEKGFLVKGSTTSKEKLLQLKTKGIEAYQFQLDKIDDEIIPFLNSDILVVNIPSKNIEGFRNLISLIEKSKIKKVLFISSTSVYKDNNTIIFENTIDSFSDSPLLEIEQLFKQSQHFKTTILRFGGLFGYSRKPGNFFSSGRSISQPDAHVNMIHRDDCIEIIYQLIIQEKWGLILNACADLHPSKRNFYTKATEVLGKTAPDFIEGEVLSFKIISNDYIKKCLNYTFKHPDILKALEL
ncbi:MAG: dTDP-glucose 4,6-dehydratase [Flavobacteriaceae bacterium]|nr:dTDP-glucose 4,6-dehydratase [Flavobacteriaceae bacterium]